MATAPEAPVRPRRRQEDRSQATRLRLMDATIACLEELGHAGTSISAICARAGLSRGALLHHFPTKNHLLAAAFLHRQRAKAAAVGAGGHAPPRTVAQEVAAIRATMQQSAALSSEFFAAVRTDDGLRALFLQLCDDEQAPIAQKYQRLNSPLDALPEPLLLRYVVGCFVRGLCLEALVTDSQTVARIEARFVALLSASAP